MNISNIPFSHRVDDSNEVLEKKFDTFSERIRVAIPGIIQSFDADKQTVSVKAAIKERMSFHGEPFENIEIPELLEVPILLPRAGNFILTMPIASGDECLLVFADNCYDSWWESGKISSQLDNRRHDLSDAFAIIGVWSQPKKIKDYSTDSTRLRNLDNSVYVEVEDTNINIIATETVTVNANKVDITAKTINATGDSINITGGNITASGDQVKIEGAASVNVDANSNTTIEGRNFLSHQHLNGGGTGLSGGVA